MELRIIEPKALKANPNNPRHTAAAAQADAQLVASIRTIGVVQPPLVQVTGTTKRGVEQLTIVAGHRRVAAAIAAGLETITVLVQPTADAATDPMKSVSENLVRAEMGPVDRWRAMEALAGAGWTDAAIADALGLSARNIAQLRLLANICPPMLDRMAQGDMPREHDLRTIAAASADEQASVWKKHKPKRTEHAEWHGIAHALSKRRLSAKNARFGADEAAAFGIVWEEDLFAPADEDSRTTTQIDAYLEAQQAWLEANLPAGGTVVPTDEYGRLLLPKGARERWTGGKPKPGDLVALAVDPRDGGIREQVYELPVRAAQPQAGDDEGAAPARKARPDVTQKGTAIIGDLRTEALHQALRVQPIDDDRLIGLLVLALGSNNVDIKTGVVGHHYGSGGLRLIAGTVIEGDVLTQDGAALRAAAREALVQVLSCRENHSKSGMTARLAGMAIDADAFLPSMADEEFLPCLSKTALEREAAALQIAAKPRAKETRTAVIERFKDATWVYPGARFAPNADELAVREQARPRIAPRDDDGDDADVEAPEFKGEFDAEFDDGLGPDPDGFESGSDNESEDSGLDDDDRVDIGGDADSIDRCAAD